MHTLPDALRALLLEHHIPSASVAVEVDGARVLHATEGHARVSPDQPARLHQAYDLASVTKALVTTPVAARLVADGQLDLHAPVQEVLPDVPTGITAAHLLTHSSGYPAWNKLYRHATEGWGLVTSRRAIIGAARRTPLVDTPGAREIYSDVGFLVLLDLLEVLGGDRLDRLFHRWVVEPAGVRDLGWGWPGAAATEDCAERSGVVQGTVHDLNCAAMGGVSSHAGLFGTASAVARLGTALLEAARGVDNGLPGAGLRALMALDGPGSHCGDFDRISAGYTSTGSFFPPDTVGHLGFTGTSVWLVPSRRAAVVVLTNRVHPSVEAWGIREFRPRIHDWIARHLGWDRSPCEDA